jgi:exonuclease III
LSPADAEGTPFTCEDKFAGLLSAGWIDAWRSRNPTAREYTWFSQQAKNGFRIDQALASPSFDRCITAVRYSHRERTDKTSDHSALIVDIAMQL